MHILNNLERTVNSRDVTCRVQFLDERLQGRRLARLSRRMQNKVKPRSYERLDVRETRQRIEHIVFVREARARRIESFSTDLDHFDI